MRSQTEVFIMGVVTGVAVLGLCVIAAIKYFDYIIIGR